MARLVVGLIAVVLVGVVAVGALFLFSAAPQPFVSTIESGFVELDSADLGPADEFPTDFVEETGSDDVETSFGPLISVDDLSKQLATESLTVLDVRPGGEYLSSHIQGAFAIYAANWKNIALEEEGLQNSEAWAKLVGDLGINRDSKVIVYGNADTITTAARIWWTLRYVGVNNVAILDGGWELWTSKEGEVSNIASQATAVEFSPDFQDDRLADIEQVKLAVSSKDVTLVDARTVQEYKKHIPGAVHLEWTNLLSEDGTFKSAAELRKLFVEQGVKDGTPCVTYCQTGGRASVNAMALELAGYKNVKNYYRSWGEWSQDAEARVAE